MAREKGLAWPAAALTMVIVACVPSSSAHVLTRTETADIRLPYDLANLLSEDPALSSGSQRSLGRRVGVAPFVLAGRSPEQQQRAAECLTSAIYHEARSEGESGQRAVAQVVLNRVRHFAYPSTICGVVYQGADRRTGCQFSFTCDGSLRRPRDHAAWAEARRIALEALGGRVYEPIGNATHYHTLAVQPYWRSGLTRLGTVGAHMFYRFRGDAGLAAAFVRQTSALERVPAAVQATSQAVRGRPAATAAVFQPRLNNELSTDYAYGLAQPLAEERQPGFGVFEQPADVRFEGVANGRVQVSELPVAE